MALERAARTEGKQYKIEATEWLCDEDNAMLQLCLSACSLNYEYIIRKVAKQGWNLNL